MDGELQELTPTSSGAGVCRAVWSGRDPLAAPWHRHTRDEPSACELWEMVVQGEWTIVAHADRGGRRLFLAQRNRHETDAPGALTRREREVVGYAARGHSLKFIGYELGISVSTVSTYLKRALRKLRLRDRAELVRAFGHRTPARAVFFTESGERATFELELSHGDSCEAFPSLTTAEKSIVGLLLEGRSNAAIARSRRTSVHTVANQLASIYRKLDVVSRSELCALVARQG